MKKIRYRLLAALVGFVALSCGDDTTTEPGDDDFLPIFSNTWRNTADQNHTFAFVSGDDGEPSGTMTGTETLDGDESDFEGTFQNSRVTNLTVHRAAGDKVFTGRFLHLDILLLISGADSVLLYRPR